MKKNPQKISKAQEEIILNNIEIAEIIKDNPINIKNLPSISYKLPRNQNISKIRNSYKKPPTFEQGTSVLPKIFLAYKPIPGRLPRDLAELKMINFYLNYSYEKIIEELKMKFSSIKNQPGNWLPLEVYDNTNFEVRSPEEYMDVIKQQNKPLVAVGIWDDNENCMFRRGFVEAYEKENDLYVGFWERSKEKFKLPRVKIFLEGEDPRLFAYRYYSAFMRRNYADSLLRYHYYIDNMPTDEISELSQEKIASIILLAQSTKTFKNKSQLDTKGLIQEINNIFSHVMNQIIFDQQYEENQKELFTEELVLCKEKEKAPANYYGMIQIPHYSFLDRFSSFGFNSLLIIKESIKCLEDSLRYSLEIEDKEIFNSNITKTLKLEEFRQMQESNISQTAYFLRETWVTKLKEIVKANLDKCQKGLFYIHETNYDTYMRSKVKKLLSMLKLQTEETIYNLFFKSFNKFTETISKFVPLSTSIESPSNVKNQFGPDVKNIPFPLFHFDMRLEDKAELPNYSFNPSHIVHLILMIFRKGVTDFQNIPQLEEKIFPLFFKVLSKSFIKTPIMPLEEPKAPTSKRELPDQNEWMWKLYAKLKKELDKTIVPLKEYLETFALFKEEYELNPEEYLKTKKKNEGKCSPSELKEDIDEQTKKLEELMNMIPQEIIISIFHIDLSEVRNRISEKHQFIIKEEIEMIAQTYRQEVEEIINQFGEINTKIKRIPKNIEDLVEIKEYMATVGSELEKLKGEIASMLETYDIALYFKYRFTPEEIRKKWIAYGGPKHVYELIDQQCIVLEREKENFLKLMKVSQEELLEKVNDIEKTVARFSQYQTMDEYTEVAKIATEIYDKLKAYQEEAKLYNNREAMVGKDQTDYLPINLLVSDFTPFYNLWSITDLWKNSYEDWMTCKWENLNAISLEEIFERSNKTMASVIRFFKDKELPGILKIAESIKSDIEKFKPFVPLAVALRTEGMKDRHWDALSQKVGFQVKPNPDFTLTTVIKMNLINNLTKCIDIAETASKEYGIECSLKKMKKEWQQVEFKLFPFKKSLTSFIGSFDEAGNILDDHIVLTQQMLSSFFKKYFEKEIEEWNQTLITVSDVIEEWAKCQNNWMYLQPIFDSNDIMRQLPNESQSFKQVDTMWRVILKETKANPGVIATCTKPNLLEKFTQANILLEDVQKGLAEYLEDKRAIFARFYFLSDDEMLQILSQTKEVENVRPHLKKVFENINDLVFQQPDKQMLAMLSAENEKIDFVNSVDPRDKNVEFWMCDVEAMMIKSVRKVLLDALQDYIVTPRINWILKHPGQCVLNASQIYWTKEVEESFTTQGGIKKYFKKLQDQLIETVNQVRKKMNKLQTITLNALIVIDVHAKDVIENLVNNEVLDINAFEWISQLRYYWEKDDCYIKCVQTIFPYGYEYLGNTSRLVITPLTDKCYMTLMGALKLNLGGAPAGPAGTGKTESTKDLAKALAKQCVVFNCSEGMDFKMVGKLFKGFASAGAWCCFDEFNRINIEVLSVIAQQLQQLFAAKGEGVPELLFEDTMIRMKPTFSIFITMNPGYAGRTELPDNLKALFRPVAMMVPDYALIAEIRLYSFGFQTARDLARKLVVTFKLSSEQLSSQFHYDYGMRAVTSVINAAGLLKQQFFDMNEDQLLLRALRDVNVPKFLKEDLPLFENIILDLFPGISRPVSNYGELSDSIKKTCEQLNIQVTPHILEKTFQLFDTTQVRHGLMIVGPAGGGKTTIYQVLSQSITSIAKKQGFAPVHVHVLNPKAVTMGQLYGEKDVMTQEWMDGILALQVIRSTEDKSRDLHWVLFDGPVDTLWIENMNSVLDDSKKLCLNSGQIIKLSNKMTMMFEVDDLSQASPATVSRCGMVYMDPNSLGIAPLFKSWTNNLTQNMKSKKNFLSKLQSLFDNVIDKSITYLRKNLKEPVITVNNNILQSFLRIVDCFFFEFRDTEIRKITAEEIDKLELILNSIVIFALIWSVGSTTTLEGRELFDKFLRDQMVLLKLDFPEKGLVFDYEFCPSTNEWKYWKDNAPSFEVDTKLSYADILIPTLDSIRLTYLIKMLLSNSKQVLTPGPTGTGKSVNINSLLSRGFNENFQSFGLTFSAQTTANQTQDSLDDKFEKRRKGVFGPPTGKKFIIFVDDLNMPKKEEYGAQPPIELLRQWMDYKGWFNRKIKEKPFMRIEDIIFIAAMGLPGGGRNVITQRFQRHFNIITLTDFQRETTFSIFFAILNSFLSKFPEPIITNLNKIVDMTLNVYFEVINGLLPTPTRSHYTFNLRDISRIVQGIVNVNPKSVNEMPDMARIWVHENQRVFGDRLINNEDRNWLKTLMESQIESILTIQKEIVYNNVERIIFGDYMQGIESENRKYSYISDLKELIKKIEQYLEEYNAENKKGMKLVMFLDACDHVSRIVRIMRQPLGNALLLGVGGSGRQSLATLASFISGFKCLQIDVKRGFNMNMWRENIKDIMKKCGVENRPRTFLFCDTQIISEQMLEDINNILNSGDIPGLYKKDDLEELDKIGYSECLKKGLQATKMNKFSQFLSRIKKNIHVVLAMSPMGEVFRNRLRKFPSLVNCCTIDWFTEWPEEALFNVGKRSLVDVEMDDMSDKCIQVFTRMHQDVEAKSKMFYDELRRYNYITPKSYLELLFLFKKIFADQKQLLLGQIKRLEMGLKVLLEANIVVADLKETLIKKSPELALIKEEVKKTKEKLALDYSEADETRKKVAIEEAQAVEKEEEASKLFSEAEKEVKVAEPELNEALKSVRELKDDKLYEIKAMKIPSKKILLVFEALIILKGVIPKKPTDPNKLKIDPKGIFECVTLNLLNDPKQFKLQLINFNKDNIPDITIQKLMPILSDENLKEKDVEQASKALLVLFKWVWAMVKYHEVLKKVNPLREVSNQLKAKVAILRKNLEDKRETLRTIDARISELERQNREKAELEQSLSQQIIDCNLKLERATKIINGLSSEKIRWEQTVKELKSKTSFLIGNSLIAAGMVGYSGAFTASYRQSLEESWTKLIDSEELKISHSPNITMKNILQDPVKVGEWINIYGLPNDNLSIENSLIMHQSRRWPLIIDPQNQANNFIKNLGNATAGLLNVLKASDPTLIKILESSIELGKWVLVENVTEKLDPALDPLLQQNKTQQGSSWNMKLGDRVLKYDDNFKFYMTTRIPNPHYTPEVSVIVTIINFSITLKGLEEQMLNQLVGLEMPDLQAKKNQILIENAKSTRELTSNEDKILASLTSYDETSKILDDVNLIEILDGAKKKAQQIIQSVEESRKAEIEIDSQREKFRSVSYRASLLFFCILDLSQIDSMYQYSLQWFTKLFAAGVQNSTPHNEPAIRVQNLNSYFTFSLFENVCRSLFEKHKLLFSFLVTIKIMSGDNKINPNEWRFFLAGPSGDIDIIENPFPWINNIEWSEKYRQIVGADKLEKFAGFKDYILNHGNEFKEIFDSDDAHLKKLPQPWESKLDLLEKMIILKILRPDKIVLAMQIFITKNLGKEYLEFPPFNLKKCFTDSYMTTPLIFILTQGSDPISEFKKFAEEMDMSKRLDMISLGQGQAEKAEKLIDSAKEKGGWVLLQNCHLSISWMPRLEVIVENLNEQVHREFRMWLTSMACKEFPASTLQNSVKMTVEPPSGLKANLQRTYLGLDNKILDECKNPDVFRKLLFGFCFFHAIIQDRRKFGPIGWNIIYEFNNEDLKVCQRQLQIFINEYKEVPYKVLTYLGAEINYGGRVTDDKDSRLIKVIIRDYINPEALKDNYKFSQSGIYYSPPVGMQEDYLAYINSLPLVPHPEVFGLHQNAEIITAQTDVRNLLELILSIQPRSLSSGGKTREQQIEEIADSIDSKTPELFDADSVNQKYPTQYGESMNTVLYQEVIRYNNLLLCMKETMKELKRALKGLVVLSEELEKIANSLYDNMVPKLWTEKGFLSLKLLAAWIVDLNRRVSFLSEWIRSGTPKVYWISGFFFPQAFLTGTLQNYARKNVIAIDRLTFEFSIKDYLTYQDVTLRPSDGCYVYGIFLEGARWDFQDHCLGDPFPKELYSDVPLTHLIPKEDRKPSKEGIYNCPVYKVLSRQGTLSTTGHSTNFVIFMEFPSKDVEAKWIKAGTAAILALRY